MRIAAGALAASVVLLVAAGTPAAAQVADTVRLANGDRLHGSMLGMEAGQLTLRAGAAGTVTVEWSAVVGLASRETFEIELDSGERLTGRLASPSRGQVVVDTESGPTEPIDLSTIVAIAPAAAGPPTRLSGSVELGLTYAKAANTRTWTLDAEGDHRLGAYETFGRVESWLFARDDAATTDRHEASLETRRLFARGWFAFGRLQAQADDELELDLRLLVGGGVGRYLLRSDRHRLSVAGGFDYDAEWYDGVEDRGDAVEALASLAWDWLPTGGSTEVTLRATTFHALDRERWRLDLDGDLRRRILAGLYLGLHVFDDFDSAPPGDRTRSDLGASLVLGWSF